MNKLAERLKDLRTENNLTIKEFSKIIMTSQTTISRWENGTRTPCIEIILFYAKFFNVSLDYLFGLED